MTRNDIIDAAVALLGTPFRHRGRSASGTDCIGLVILIGRSVGAVSKDFDYLDYEKMPRGKHFVNLDDHLDRIRLRSIRSGSILVLKRTLPCHLGIVTDDRGATFIHAFENAGAVVRDDLRHYMMTSYLKPCAAFDYRGIDG